MPNCGQCGAPMELGAKFCGSCGALVPEPEGPEGNSDETIATTDAPQEPPAQAAAPAPQPTAPAGNPAPPAAPAGKPKKKGKGCLIVILLLLVVGFVVVAAGGVVGYIVLKKRGAWPPWHKAQPAAEAPAETEQEPPAEEPYQESQTAPSEQEATPAPMEESTPPAQEPSHPATSTRQTRPSAPKSTPPAPSYTPPSTPPPSASAEEPASTAPETETAAPSKEAKAPFGLIFEADAAVTKLVVKVDKVPLLSQGLAPTGGQLRIAQELVTTAGPHRVRVAAWRADGPPVAQEWDYTFEHGAHPVFKVEVAKGWTVSMKQLE